MRLCTLFFAVFVLAVHGYREYPKNTARFQECGIAFFIAAIVFMSLLMCVGLMKCLKCFVMDIHVRRIFREFFRRDLNEERDVEVGFLEEDKGV